MRCLLVSAFEELLGRGRVSSHVKKSIMVHAKPGCGPSQMMRYVWRFEICVCGLDEVCRQLRLGPTISSLPPLGPTMLPFFNQFVARGSVPAGGQYQLQQDMHVQIQLAMHVRSNDTYISACMPCSCTAGTSLLEQNVEGKVSMAATFRR